MIKFGTGGWRAVIGDEFTKENIQLVAQGLCDLMHDKKIDGKKVIIGHDRRFLSDEGAIWFAEVLSANGIQVILMGRSMPTPVIMHYVQKQDLEIGIEITASHNPSSYNGIKIIIKEGRDAPQEFTDELEGYINKLTAADIKAKKIPNENSEVLQTPFNDYLDDILSQLDIESMRKHGARV
ncbi:MAG: phosphoglucomutase/phosphomannomutase family protein, partial [Clostridia bacterium]|nr:phosphoglucomutase/phosphomannomutase family protein [Clostridia bacterium]